MQGPHSPEISTSISTKLLGHRYPRRHSRLSDHAEKPQPIFNVFFPDTKLGFFLIFFLIYPWHWVPDIKTLMSLLLKSLRGSLKQPRPPYCPGIKQSPFIQVSSENTMASDIIPLKFQCEQQKIYFTPHLICSAYQMQ